MVISFAPMLATPAIGTLVQLAVRDTGKSFGTGYQFHKPPMID